MLNNDIIANFLGFCNVTIDKICEKDDFIKISLSTTPESQTALIAYRIEKTLLSEITRFNGKWQQPILPAGCPTSTFGAAELNFCVRNENRWDLSAIVTTMVI